MPSIPLPALGIRPPEQPDVMAQYAKAVQLKSLMQQQQLQQGQLQQQQQDMQDRQAMTKAWQNWNPSDGPDGLIKAAKAAGASGNALAAASKWALDQKKTNTELAEKDAITGEKKAQTIKLNHDQAAGQLTALKGMPDDQIMDAVIPTAQRVAQLDPQYAQQTLQWAQQAVQSGDPNKIRQFADMASKYYLSNSQQIEQASKDVENKYKAAQTKEAEQKAETMKEWGSATLGADDKYIRDQMLSRGLPNTPQTRATLRDEYIQKTKIQPGMARAEVFLRRPTEVLDPENPGQTIIVPGTQAYGMAGKSSVGQTTLSSQAKKAQPQFVAFDTADQHLQLIEQAGKALQNNNIQALNQIANSYGVAVGKDPVTTFKALTTVAAPEIVRASAGSGQMSEKEIEVARNNFDPKLSPRQITANVAAMRGLMAGKKAALQKNIQGLKGGDIGGGTMQFTDNGRTYNIPANMVDEFKKDHPNAR